MSMVTLPFEAAQRMFDALVNSMDFGSGFLETDDVKALRTLADAIGVDPALGTPREFKPDFPHLFEPAPWDKSECGICVIRGRKMLADNPIHTQCESMFGERRCGRPAGHGGSHRKERVSWNS